MRRSFTRRCSTASNIAARPFFQAYTTCQPEHGVSDNMSADQAKMVRDGRGMPEFVFNHGWRGEDIAGGVRPQGKSRRRSRDWWRTKFKDSGEEYSFTVAHWAITEGRFRKHVKAVKEEEEAREMILMDDMLVFITQEDVIYRRMFDPEPSQLRAESFGVFTSRPISAGRSNISPYRARWCSSRSSAAKPGGCCQSKAGVVNKDYLAQKALLAKLDKGELQLAELQAKTRELFDAELAKL